MADVVEFAVHNGVSWTAQGAGEYIRLGGSGGPNTNVSLNTFNRYFSFSDAGGSIVTQGQNTAYIGTSDVSLNGGGSITLNSANVAIDDCSLRYRYSQDGGGATTISNIKFFAYQGSTSTPPPNVTVVAFFHDGTSVFKDTVTPVVGGAWNDGVGIGGIASALDVDYTGGSLVEHLFYFGLCAKVSQSGEVAFSLGLEYDVS